MSHVYMARGRSVATAATAEHAVSTLWNPHAAIRICVREVWLVTAAAPGAGAGIHLRRATARGTPGSTVTPTIENDTSNTLAPPSGALVDLAAYTAQPTLAALPSLAGWIFAAVAASGIIMPFPNGITIPPGEGLTIANNAAIIIPASDITFVWEE